MLWQKGAQYMTWMHFTRHIIRLIQTSLHLIMAVLYPYRFQTTLWQFVSLQVFETKSKIIQQNTAFNNQIEKHICHHNRLKPSRDNLQKLSVGYSSIKIFVRQL